MNHERRVIEIPGLLNVRDLGGLPVEGGGETKFGRIFRGPQPDDLDESAVKELGVDRIIDLRTEAEGQDGRSSRIAQMVEDRHEVSVLNEPMTPERLIEASERGPAPTYIGMLDDLERVSEVLELLSDDSNLPTYVHCTLGKDRTGVITALILSAIGVHREAIVEDYALTGRYIEQIMARRMSSKPGARERMEAIGPHVLKIIMGAEPETMEKTLAGINEKYGSAAEYVLALENGEAILTGLKRKLLSD